MFSCKKSESKNNPLRNQKMGSEYGAKRFRRHQVTRRTGSGMEKEKKRFEQAEILVRKKSDKQLKCLDLLVFVLHLYANTETVSHARTLPPH